ncbi:endonuclease/exonuclease/phosphatase family protein [Spirillospora sp. CA-294931]|uniref:endonuclease/exonuclease/phosphatase family protein n=1 Tax=Spirillospora sp. CA-294931 TaxID=3240042 RepID=UPI003D94711D
MVVAAGAGAAIDGSPDIGPLHGDAPREVSASDVTLNAMTWNVCGDGAPDCPSGIRPADVVKKITALMKGGVAGGQKVTANVVMLQRVCEGQLKSLRQGGLRSWSWAFAPSRPAKGKTAVCGGGQGQSGVALGTERKLSGVQRVALPSPAIESRTALCGTVAAWSTRVCTARLSSAAKGDDPRGEWRERQTQALAGLLSGPRAVLGADLVDPPNTAPLDVLYRGFRECGQGPKGERTGAGTRQDGKGRAVDKVDYLFTTKSAQVTCGVPAAPMSAATHRPLYASVHFS